MVISIILLICILFIILSYIYTLRDPGRVSPSGNNIVSPADGRVIKIEKIDKSKLKIKKGLFGKINVLVSDVIKEGFLISIFMSLGNVHVNRAPISGKITNIKHKSGKFFFAFDPQKSFLNERNEITMESRMGKIKIIQIAGFLARRIECYVKKNQHIRKGEKIGRIIIGSQVSMVLPGDVSLLVGVGDKVKAGESILAKY
jgi:phosphatidylserine decarboxylase